MTEWKIYTKTGDKGETSLIGGKRVPKYHQRIEAYGTVDELNSFVGLIREHDIGNHFKEILLKIQDKLFVAESILARDEGEVKVNIPELKIEDINMLEDEIDLMQKDLPELNSFILPGGHIAAAYCHVARTVCRRAERIIIKLSESIEIDDILLRFFNRLSDYFFVLARKIAYENGGGDILWNA
ncbi:MAG: cob(I)yrinic acid a,c-diamide adenosyltransferase [Bacteroidota bacterium]